MTTKTETTLHSFEKEVDLVIIDHLSN